mgnify:CR=1 FL=1
MIDVLDLANPAALSAADFQFRSGTSTDVGAWAAAPAPFAITVREKAGVNGADRIAIRWLNNNRNGVAEPNEAVAKAYLEVKLLANANTGLPADDTFYFANLVGDSGAGNSAAIAIVNATDELGARNETPGLKPITNVHDYDRNRVVTANDQLLARNNAGSLLFLTVPS